MSLSIVRPVSARDQLGAKREFKESLKLMLPINLAFHFIRKFLYFCDSVWDVSCKIGISEPDSKPSKLKDVMASKGN